jgi:hypothetical protein
MVVSRPRSISCGLRAADSHPNSNSNSNSIPRASLNPYVAPMMRGLSEHGARSIPPRLALALLYVHLFRHLTHPSPPITLSPRARALLHHYSSSLHHSLLSAQAPTLFLSLLVLESPCFWVHARAAASLTPFVSRSRGQRGQDGDSGAKAELARCVVMLVIFIVGVVCCRLPNHARDFDSIDLPPLEQSSPYSALSARNPAPPASSSALCWHSPRSPLLSSELHRRGFETSHSVPFPQPPLHFCPSITLPTREFRTNHLERENASSR